MDPAQLLNPKAFAKQKAASQKQRSKTGIPRYGPQQSRKPAAPTNNGTMFQTPTFDPRVLLDPRSALGNKPQEKPQVDHNLGPNGVAMTQADDSEVGLGRMLERMHNVQNREASSNIAHKRKRTPTEDDDETKERPKSTASHSQRAGGILGDHLKKDRERMGAESGPVGTPIDLTNDDEDVQVIQEGTVQESANDEICLGMTKASANVDRIPFVSARAVALVSAAKQWPRARVDFRRAPAEHNVIDLYDRQGNKFGKVDHRIALGLCPLLDRPDLHKARMVVWLDPRPKAPDEVIGKATSKVIPISIIIYARRSCSNRIGRYLSQKNIFLSPPFNAGASHREYENPQLPKDYSGRGTGAGRSQQALVAPTMTRTVEEMRREASSMIDGLVKNDELPEMDADNRYIITPLLSHQKQALQFLVQHESDDQDQSHSLWKETQKKNGGDIWYNIITGHELTEKPAPIKGGILADMMGLGKTLSILSLIAATRDEAKAFPNREQSKKGRYLQATLIICPKSVMSNWHEQIRAHTHPDQFNVYAYHGATRTQSIKDLAKYDIVLTTYNTAAAEFNAKNRALAAVQWFRIVLDEAHQIRNQNTQVSKACCALVAERRWAVTGTPVQNSLNDLCALFKFLHVRPFDEPQAWAQYIIAPFKLANTDVLQHLRLLVDSITLRRVKDSIDLTERSEKRVRLDFTEEERKVYARVAGDSNRQLRLMTGGSNKALKGKSYAHVLKSIGRMRMLCAHGLDLLNEDDRKEIAEGMDPENAIAIDLGEDPALGPYQFVSERQAYETLHMMSDSDVNRCTQCDRKIGDLETPAEDAEDGESSSPDEDSSDEESIPEQDIIGYLTPCYHLVCPSCKENHDKTIRPLLTADERYTCQYCETYIRYGVFELHRSALQDFVNARKDPKSRRWDGSNYTGPSTKVSALIDDLKVSLEETRQLGPDEPPIRSVVFSGWTTYLSLIEIALEENGIGYLRLDGTMSIRARTAVLSKFRSDPTVVVLLVSIKAGGQGLNLTAANKVYMMEPQFNPGVEHQAIDRVHRLGQTRNVFVTHYIMKDSVEEGILKLQRKKEDLAHLSLNRKLSTAEVQKQKLEDLKELFK